jgi:amidase
MNEAGNPPSILPLSTDPASPHGVDRRSFLAGSGVSALSLAAGLGGIAPWNANAQSAGSEITGWSADTLAGHIKAKDVSCREVMEAYLAQIDRLNPRVNAIIQLQDRDGLLAQATERDDQLARGEYLGWMHGMPQAIKDTAWAKGIISTAGSPINKDFVPPVDSLIVERARAAGAILLGKTNVPEWALGSNTFNPIYGSTNNPYNLRKTVGGSSGGAGAALAARMLPVADGSDMGGSIRNPSAYCNVYGLRPSAGVVPFWPSDELFIQQFAIEGPMGRTVRDVAMLLSIQAGSDPRAPLSVNLDPAQFTAPLERDMTGTRIAWMGDWNGHFPLDPGVKEICEASLKTFTDLGCIVEEATPNFDPAELWQVWLTLRAFIMGNYLGVYYADATKKDMLSANAIWEVERSFTLTQQQVFAASVSRTAWHMAVEDFFSRYDFAIAPTAQVFPFDTVIPYPTVVGGRTMETYHQWMEIVLPWTLAGTAVMNAPVGFNADGLPMGIQIIGKRQSELAVLQMARAYEQATGWVEKYPPPIL